MGVQHGTNKTFIQRQGAAERQLMAKEEVYFAHDGDMVYLPPDYQRPILLRLRKSSMGANEEERTGHLRMQQQPSGDGGSGSGGGEHPTAAAGDVGGTQVTTISAAPRREGLIERKRKWNTIRDEPSNAQEESRDEEEQVMKPSPTKRAKLTTENVEEDQCQVGRQRNDENESINLLRAMFSSLREEEIHNVLRENGHKVNLAIDSLLNLVAIHDGEAGSLPLESSEIAGVARHGLEDEHFFSEGNSFEGVEDQLVDSIVDAVVNALDECYKQKKASHRDAEVSIDDEISNEEDHQNLRSWSCAHCTFVNFAIKDKCAICSQPRKSTLDHEDDSHTNMADAKEMELLRREGKEKEDILVSPAENGNQVYEIQGHEETRGSEEGEAQRRRRELIEKEDEDLKEQSPGWIFRRGPLHQERMYFSSQSLKVLPVEIQRFQNLKMLVLDSNELEWLPSEIGDVSQLEGLFLKGNHIRRLPMEMGKLLNLRWLDVSNNRLRDVGNELISLFNLHDLLLSDNELSHIPASLRLLPKLSRLHLENNKITHIDPTLFFHGESFPRLQELWLSRNPLRHIPFQLFHLCQKTGLGLQVAGCKFNETEKEICWEVLPNQARRHIINIIKEGSETVASLYHLCLTYLYQTDKTSIVSFGLPDSVVAYLWKNLNRCCICERVFIGQGVGKAIHLMTPPGTDGFISIPTDGHYCSLHCACGYQK